MADERLTLPEELLLLGWNDERGRNRSTENPNMLVAGATVLELALRGAVTIERHRLQATDAHTGHPALDRVLAEIRARHRPRTTKAWVRRLGSRGRLRTMVLGQLVDRGILQRDTRRVLGIVPVTRHPVVDRTRVGELRGRVTRVLTDAEPVSDPRDAALGGLVHPAGWKLLRRLVSGEQRRDARRRARALSKGEAVSADVAKAIGDANAATMAAVAGAAAASSSGGS